MVRVAPFFWLTVYIQPRRLSQRVPSLADWWRQSVSRVGFSAVHLLPVCGAPWCSIQLAARRHVGVVRTCCLNDASWSVMTHRRDRCCKAVVHTAGRGCCQSSPPSSSYHVRALIAHQLAFAEAFVCCIAWCRRMWRINLLSLSLSLSLSFSRLLMLTVHKELLRDASLLSATHYTVDKSPASPARTYPMGL